MDSSQDSREDRALDALFEVGRARPPLPSSAFLSRLEADAVASLPQRPVETAPRRRGLPRWFGFPGIFAASGLSLSAATGVIIGFASPDLVSPYTTLSDTGDEIATLYTFLPGADLAALDE